MTNETPATITSIEDAGTARWLTNTLQPVRARVAAGPSDEAIERIRAHIFGEPARRKRTLAA